MTDALNVLLSLCERATPGPWFADGPCIHQSDDELCDVVRCDGAYRVDGDLTHDDVTPSQASATAAFIAAANPRTVAALVRVVVEDIKMAECSTKDWRDWSAAYDRRQVTLAALKEALDV